MNLVARMLQRQQPQNANRQSIIDMANGIRNGTINAKDECMHILHSMNREQKRQLANMFPMFRSFAKRQGMADGDIKAFMQEVNI